MFSSYLAWRLVGHLRGFSLPQPRLKRFFVFPTFVGSMRVIPYHKNHTELPIIYMNTERDICQSIARYLFSFWRRFGYKRNSSKNAHTSFTAKQFYNQFLWWQPRPPLHFISRLAPPLANSKPRKAHKHKKWCKFFKNANLFTNK